jgi:eukaryotic-like serine/threonine-protein kinase
VNDYSCFYNYPHESAMTSERWQSLKALFYGALKEGTQDRAAFIGAIRDGEFAPKKHLDHFVEAEQQETGTLDAPPTYLDGCLDSVGPRFQPGELVVGRFRIVRPIGKGGMGEVYEAEDLQLGTIALKTIRNGVASSSDAFELFRQEVQLARRVSGPQVCRIHELYLLPASGGYEATAFLTMEYLDGITLYEKLYRDGPLRWKEALSITLEICEGLRLIHEKGIIHRDLKTSNIMLCKQAGAFRVVLMDFGLARDFNADAKSGSSSPVQRPGNTLPQMIMGTPKYMAPEQFEAKPVSPATDIYALGIILYGLVTGLHPYGADNTVAAAIRHAKHPIPASSLRPNIPREFDRVIEHCLEYEPEKRFQSAKEVIRALKPPESLSRRGQIAIAAVLILLVTAGGFLLRRNAGRRVIELRQLTPETDLSGSPSLSRDGKVVAYSSDRAETGNTDIFTQRLPGGRAIRITTNVAQDDYPSVSPDGTSVVFRSERNSGGIYMSSVDGGQEHLLVPYGRNPQFSPDGSSILFWVGDLDPSVPSGKLYLLHLSGGPPVRIARSFRDARLPLWSNDGHLILFSACGQPETPMPACSDWWVMSMDGTILQNTHALAVLSDHQIVPTEGTINAWYNGHLLLSGRKGGQTSLWEVSLNPRTFKVTGNPQQLTSGEARDLDPTLAASGTLAYTQVVGALHLWRIDHASQPEAAVQSKLTEDPSVDISPFISPNGRWLVFSRGWDNHRDVWIKDTSSMTEAPILASGLEMMSPIIDDTGKFLAFEARERNVPSIFASVDGGLPKRLCIGCSLPTSWFDSNRAILYRDGSPSTINMIDPQTGKHRPVLKQDGASLSEPSWSDKTEYLLFTRQNEGEGNKQIFAVRFPKPTASVEGKWIPITEASESSDRPRWSGDGRTIYYLSTRDGFSCLWGQSFHPEAGETSGPPFAVMHYHNRRNSIDVVAPRSFNLSVAGDSIYFNLGESSSSIWIGKLRSENNPLGKLF